MGRHAPRGLRTIPIAFVVVLAAAGCGGTSGPGATTPEVSAVTGPGGAGEKSVTDYVEYIGGKAGKADPSKLPTDLHRLAQPAGRPAGDRRGRHRRRRPGRQVRQRAARRHRRTPGRAEEVLHQERRGRGHDLRPEAGNDKDVSVIDVGGVAIGIQPFYSTIGGKKPVIVGVAVTPVDGVQDERDGPVRRRDARARPVRHLRQGRARGEDRGARLPEHRRHHRRRGGDRTRGSKAAGIEVKKVGLRAGPDRPDRPADRRRRADRRHRHPVQRASGCVNQAKG